MAFQFEVAWKEMKTHQQIDELIIASLNWLLLAKIVKWLFNSHNLLDWSTFIIFLSNSWLDKSMSISVDLFSLRKNVQKLRWWGRRIETINCSSWTWRQILSRKVHSILTIGLSVFVYKLLFTLSYSVAGSCWVFQVNKIE